MIGADELELREGFKSYHGLYFPDGAPVEAHLLPNVRCRRHLSLPYAVRQCGGGLLDGRTHYPAMLAHYSVADVSCATDVYVFPLIDTTSLEGAEY